MKRRRKTFSQVKYKFVQACFFVEGHNYAWTHFPYTLLVDFYEHHIWRSKQGNQTSEEMMCINRSWSELYFLALVICLSWWEKAARFPGIWECGQPGDQVFQPNKAVVNAVKIAQLASECIVVKTLIGWTMVGLMTLEKQHSSWCVSRVRGNLWSYQETTIILLHEQCKSSWNTINQYKSQLIEYTMHFPYPIYIEYSCVYKLCLIMIICTCIMKHTF